MKVWCGVLGILLAWPCMAQQNVSKTTSVFSEEGKLQMTISYDPSCACRSYTEYYPDGKVYAKRQFKVVDKGEYVDGEDVTYYHDGTIKQYKLWKQALPSGKAFFNYENGKTEHEEYYAENYKSGTWQYFDRNGALIASVTFIGKLNAWNGKRRDYIVKRYQDGKLLYTEEFKNGKLIRSDKKTATVTAGKAPNNPVSGIESGETLFRLKCAACHSFNKNGYGPSLAGVTKRRSKIWLHKMIVDGMKLVEQGDKEALAVYHLYGNKKHIPQTQLSEQQVDAIIRFLYQQD